MDCRSLLIGLLAMYAQRSVAEAAVREINISTLIGNDPATAIAEQITQSARNCNAFRGRSKVN